MGAGEESCGFYMDEQDIQDGDGSYGIGEVETGDVTEGRDQPRRLTYRRGLQFGVVVWVLQVGGGRI